MRKKIVKLGANYIEVDVPDYANGETLKSECFVIEPAENLKKPKMTFIDKIVMFFDKCIERYVS